MSDRSFVFGVDLDGVVADFARGLKPVAAEWLGIAEQQLTDEISYGFGEWGLDAAGGYDALHRFAVKERELFARYVRRRRETDNAFNEAAFAQVYATMAAQRATKILGIFARLDKRDRKPQYLRHMPRVWRYLQRALLHPQLAPLAAWYKGNVPAFDGM